MSVASGATERTASPGLRLTWFWDVPEFRRAMGLILVFGLSCFLLLPLLTLLLWAFTDEWRYPSVLPQSYSFKWWEWVFTNGDVGSAVRYSFMTAPVVTLLAAIICLPAAYSFSRFRFPGRRALFISLLAANDVGAGFLTVLWRIVLPMNLVPLLIVLTFTFIGVIGSFTIPYLIGPNAPQMMGVAIQAYFSNYNQPQAAVAMAVMLFLIATVAGAIYVWATSRSNQHAVTV